MTGITRSGMARNVGLIASLILTLSFASQSHAAAFMKLGDIKGEATDRDHKEWIIIESTSSGLLRVDLEPDPTGQCGLRTKGDTTLGDVVVVRQLDKSSVKLQEAACSGKIIAGDVIIDSVANKTRGPAPYLRYKLKDVIISSYSVAPGPGGLPMEEITLNGKVEFQFSP